MISPLAYVDPEAKLGKNVTVLPFAYIEKNVEIGDDCVIMSYASILQGTKMGKGSTNLCCWQELMRGNYPDLESSALFL